MSRHMKAWKREGQLVVQSILKLSCLPSKPLRKQMGGYQRDQVVRAEAERSGALCELHGKPEDRSGDLSGEVPRDVGVRGHREPPFHRDARHGLAFGARPPQPVNVFADGGERREDDLPRAHKDTRQRS